MKPKPAEGKIWRLLVHPSMTEGLIQFIESKGLHLFPLRQENDDEFAEYGIGIGPSPYAGLEEKT